MKVWFDPSNDSFYLGQWFPEQPEGTQEITLSAHSDMLKAQDEGLIISHDENGYPVAISPPVRELTHDEQVQLAENQRTELLNQADMMTSDWRVELMLGDITEADKAKLQEWMDYKRKVKDVDTATAPDLAWPQPPAA